MTATIQTITAGNRHTCAVTDAGAVKCWGGNDTGQIGDGTLQNRLVPTETLTLASGVTAVSTGSSHTCVLLTTGAARCWGSDGDGELGIGSVARRYAATPVVDVLPRELFLNYATGKPGSIFSVSGFGYAAGSNVTLSANETVLDAPLPVNALGSFVAQLDTTGADVGFYLISASPQAVIASTVAAGDPATLILDDSAVLHPQEGGGSPTRTVPTGIADPLQKLFLPVVRR